MIPPAPLNKGGIQVGIFSLLRNWIPAGTGREFNLLYLKFSGKVPCQNRRLEPGDRSQEKPKQQRLERVVKGRDKQSII
jgi:hypothetical protein